MFSSYGCLNSLQNECIPASRFPAKARDQRPAFDALCRDATKRQFDLVMAWSVDRLGRSLKDLVAFLSELHALRITYSSTSRVSTPGHLQARRCFR